MATATREKVWALLKEYHRKGNAGQMPEREIQTELGGGNRDTIRKYVREFYESPPDEDEDDSIEIPAPIKSALADARAALNRIPVSVAHSVNEIIRQRRDLARQDERASKAQSDQVISQLRTDMERAEIAAAEADATRAAAMRQNAEAQETLAQLTIELEQAQAVAAEADAARKQADDLAEETVRLLRDANGKLQLAHEEASSLRGTVALLEEELESVRREYDHLRGERDQWRDEALHKAAELQSALIREAGALAAKEIYERQLAQRQGDEPHAVFKAGLGWVNADPEVVEEHDPSANVCDL